MNTKQMMLAALMIGATINLSQAQSFYPVLKNFSAAEKERMDKIYAVSLSSTHSHLVESALTIVTMMKLDLPADEFPMVSDKITYLAAHSEVPMIRYRACLAEAVFAHPELFKEIVVSRYNDPEELFSALAGGTTKTILSSK